MNERRLARFTAACAQLPLIAILRGLPPEDAEAVALTLYTAGFRLLEVPLNSPQPFASIEQIRQVLPGDALVGAGTVLRVDDVDTLTATGADLLVAPNINAAVIAAGKRRGMICVPGVATPSEAFAALDAGADALKLFPAELISPPVLKAMRTVLPKTTPLFAVGGISPDKLAAYAAAGANGCGLGSALYTPGLTLAQLAAQAERFIAAWTNVASNGAGPDLENRR